jgi:hypothetical protein
MSRTVFHPARCGFTLHTQNNTQKKGNMQDKIKKKEEKNRSNCRILSQQKILKAVSLRVHSTGGHRANTPQV